MEVWVSPRNSQNTDYIVARIQAETRFIEWFTDATPIPQAIIKYLKKD